MDQTSQVRGEGRAVSFPYLMKTWRRRRRLSQLDLALSAGVSQRHISFLESGRAKPSRQMIMKISETLQVPLRDRNGWFVAAGFAPVFAARPLDDPQMDQVMAAIRLMLANHEPFPAAVIDRAWNIRMTNAPFERLSAMIGANGTERNLMRLFFRPGGIKPFVANWEAIAPLIWQRAVREAEAAGGDDMRSVLAELAPFQDAAVLSAAEEPPLLPVLPLVIAKDGVRISLFTVISTFGTAQDVTAEELRIECFFPADQQTEGLFRNAGGA